MQLANTLSRRPPLHGRSTTDYQVQVCWPMCSFSSTRTTCHFVDSLRSLLVKVLILHVRPWPVGWARRASYLLRWSMRLRSMFSLHRRSTQTTRRCPYWLPATARPRPAGFGHMYAMIGPQAIQLPQRFGSPIQKIERVNIREDI